MASVEVSNVRKSFGQFRGDSRRLDQGKDGAPIIAAELRKRRPKPHSVWHLDEVYVRLDGRMTSRRTSRMKSRLRSVAGAY